MRAYLTWRNSTWFVGTLRGSSKFAINGSAGKGPSVLSLAEILLMLINKDYRRVPGWEKDTDTLVYGLILLVQDRGRRVHKE